MTTSIARVFACCCIVAAPAFAQTQAGKMADAVVYASSANAKFMAMDAKSPIKSAALFGDANKDAPHGEFVTFPPNFDAGGWHVHTNTVNLVVIKGAYIYRDENGEKRVAAGQFIRIPGGHRHWSGSDAKEGALFYMHSQAKMDQIASPK